MKTIKFLMITAVALFTVNFANAQTPQVKTTAKTTEKTTVKTTPVKEEKKVSKVENHVVKKGAHKHHKKA